jgi:hypothetical protein
MMRQTRLGQGLWVRALLAVWVSTLAAELRAEVPLDLQGYDPSCGIQVRREGDRLSVGWPIDDREAGRAILDLAPGRPLLASLAMGTRTPSTDLLSGPAEPILERVEPATFVTVGSRNVPQGRPPEMSNWNVFFDKPASRPHQTYLSQLQKQRARVSSQGRRASVSIDQLTVGPFRGQLQLTFYAGSRLVHVEAVVSTREDRLAILYDAGLVAGAATGESSSAAWTDLAWTDLGGQVRRTRVDAKASDEPVAVRHRAIVAESPRGSVACFPPPHQYHFPRDWTDNLKFAWMGRDHAGQSHPFGFGIRQVADGRRAFEPWFNAPPNTQQRLGAFYLLSRGRAEDALRKTLRYTHADKFVPLPGQITFTSHYHMALAVTAMQRQFQWTPEAVSVFKQMGVNAVHLGEFHGDGHQKDPGPLRLPELEAMFNVCRTFSDAEFLLIPGEEVNDFLGLKEPGKHPGHWMSLFPKPVYWVMQRAEGEPPAEPHPRYGTLYRVGTRKDMMELLEREGGLAWAAHPRIKASSWTPDIFRHEEFYKANYWLGGAWKAMPADLSHERLGQRVLDLIDDMANWGPRKYVPGEVDVFKIDHSHELYGHMNINYLRLARVPRFEEGWQTILDALRAGQFFTTTGEILLHEFTVGGKQSGEKLELSANPPELRVDVQWTFPLRFAEIISGDGQKVYRQRVDLSDTGPFGRRTLSLEPELKGRKWVRFEVWDVAVNGAYTQPVWLD